MRTPTARIEALERARHSVDVHVVIAGAGQPAARIIINGKPASANYSLPSCCEFAITNPRLALESVR